MVIKTLIQAWRNRGAMHHMYDNLMEMLADTEWMFRTVGRVFFENVPPDEVGRELYARDIRVNKAERSIRRSIVEHLTIHPGGDVPACLVLMSIVKDAERIGDYCKNLYEVRAVLYKDAPADQINGEIRRVHERVVKTFEMTKKALVDGDEATAENVVTAAKETARDIEEKVAEVAGSELPARAAVCRALALRHMKRVHAHLCNIATSVIQPVHKLDYFDEGFRRPPQT